MGIDARIYFEKIGDLDFIRPMPNGFLVKELETRYHSLYQGATHEIENYSRYYGKVGDRGDWVGICSALMILYSCPGVGRVWYGPDYLDEIPEFSIEKVVELSWDFMLSGRRSRKLMFTLSEIPKHNKEGAE